LAKVLYLLYDGLTDPLPQSQVLPYLIGLTKYGYEFTIISFDKPDLYQKNKNLINDICKANNIQWISLPYTKKPPILSTIYDLYKLFFFIKSYFKKNPFDMIHCRSYLVAIVGNAISKKFNVKMLFDIRGFWADEKVDSKSWDIKKPIFKKVYDFFKKKEKILFKESDAIVCLTSASKNYILKNHGEYVNESKIQVIPCCVDTSLFVKQNDEIQKTKKELGINTTDFVLCYLGSVGTWYELGHMFQFFNLLSKKIDNAKFLFVSNSPKDIIEEEAIKQGTNINNIVVLNSPRKDVPKYLSICDLSVFFYKNVYSAKGCSPTKQGELMSMGIPLVCNSGIGDTSEIIKNYDAGFLVNEYSEQEMNRIIDAFMLKTFDKTRIRNGAIEYYNLNVGIERYKNIYDKLIM
jgi:glycosyltransferase involved in cell wall biosynthesis